MEKLFQKSLLSLEDEEYSFSETPIQNIQHSQDSELYQEHDSNLETDLLSFENFQESFYKSDMENEENCDSDEEIVEDNENEDEKVVYQPEKNLQFTPCVIIDNDNDERILQRCNRTKSVRSVYQLTGNWEIDSQAEREIGDEVSKLGICLRHMNYDQNTLHKPDGTQQRIKSECTIENSKIRKRRCLFCNKIKCFFTRGNLCKFHTWNICGRNIQVPCRGLHDCPAISAHETLSQRSSDNSYSRFICTECFMKHGGHLHLQQGSGKKSVTCIDQGQHKNDTTLSLRMFAQWIDQTASSNDEIIKVNLLNQLTSVLSNISTTNSNLPQSEDQASTAPNAFLISTAFAIKNIKLSEETMATELKPAKCEEMGRVLGHSVLQSRSALKERLLFLEQPSSLSQYYDAMPQTLTSFFSGIISVLLEKRQQVLARKRKQLNQPMPELKETTISKITVFFTSVILTIAFRHWKIWFTHILASLCQRPKLLTSLQAVLREIYVVSYVKDHEIRVQKKRMIAADPRSRLVTDSNILNLAIIDNIDMANITFQYGNIYDVTRNTAHATLRMVFQFRLPEFSMSSIEELPEGEHNLFGRSPLVQQWEQEINTIFYQLLKKKQKFATDDVDVEIRKHITSAPSVPPPNVVILEAGNAPSRNEPVHQAVDMYLDDFGCTENGVLTLVCDEAIFHRMKSYANPEQTVNCVLGQWHTNKAMCSALIAAFSGYGLFGLAAELGVRFFDKLEQIADYRATFRVLELIWTAVGIAIHLHAEQNNICVSDIPAQDNNLLKVWYYYYQWAGYLKLHKLAIRMANFDLQLHCLMAFAPLFPATAKRRYAESVAYFLSTIKANPNLHQNLKAVPSVNLTQKGHYFAYDEALETFGVKFVKQNMTGFATDEENLKRNIKAVQTERERLDLLISEFAGDKSVSRGSRAIKDRQEAMWSLVEKLQSAFRAVKPEKHFMFDCSTQLTSAGYQRMFRCYELGTSRLNTIVNQDINRTEPRSTKGRGVRNVTPMKAAALKQIKKTTTSSTSHVVQQSESAEIDEPTKEHLQSTSLEHLTVEARTSTESALQPVRRRYHKPSPEEEAILQELDKYKDSTVLPGEVVDELVENLAQHTDHWTRQRIRARWHNKKKNKKGNCK